MLLRSFDTRRQPPRMQERLGPTPATLAIHPMDRGWRATGEHHLLPAGRSLEGQLATMHDHWDTYDGSFLHPTQTDRRPRRQGRDAKAAATDADDAITPALVALAPDVLAVTGHHFSRAPLTPTPGTRSRPRCGDRGPDATR